MTRSFRLEINFYLFGTFDAADVTEVLAHANLGPAFRVDVHMTPETAEPQKWPLTEAPFCKLILEADAPLVAKALASPHVITLSAAVEQPEDPLGLYLELIQVLSLLVVSDGAVAIVDLRTGMITSAEYWATKVAIPLASNEFEMSDHVEMQAIQQDDGLFWLSTRGLIKFGKPELSVHGLSHENVPLTGALLGSLGGSIVMNNACPGDGDTIVQTKGEIEYVATHGGSYQDDDFWGNVHIEFARRSPG